jgi:8-hydroxy-5-deazaflavin:NADPH oxidoreductase
MPFQHARDRLNPRAVNATFLIDLQSRQEGGIEMRIVIIGQTVSDRVASIGLRPVDAGPLRHARHLEGMGFLGIHLNMTHGWGWNTVWKLVGA